MKIVYPPLINADGAFQNAEADLEGTVTLNVTVRGRNATIVLPVREALALFRALKGLDVEALARIYAA